MVFNVKFSLSRFFALATGPRRIFQLNLTHSQPAPRTWPLAAARLPFIIICSFAAAVFKAAPDRAVPPTAAMVAATAQKQRVEQATDQECLALVKSLTLTSLSVLCYLRWVESGGFADGSGTRFARTDDLTVGDIVPGL